LLILRTHPECTPRCAQELLDTAILSQRRCYNSYRKKAAETKGDENADAAEKTSEQGFSEGNLLHRSEDAASKNDDGAIPWAYVENDEIGKMAALKI